MKKICLFFTLVFCIFNFSCCNVIENNHVDGEKKIVIIKKGNGRPTDYICELLDEDILELESYKEVGDFERHGTKEWVFNIRNAGTARIKWTYYSGNTLAKEYLEIYTINEDGSYDCVTETLAKYINYIIQYIDYDNEVNKGFFVDANGYKCFFDLSGKGSNLYEYDSLLKELLANYDTYEKGEKMDHDKLLNINQLNNAVDDKAEISQKKNTKNKTQINYIACRIFLDQETPYVIRGIGNNEILNDDESAKQIFDIMSSEDSYWKLELDDGKKEK